MLHCMILEFFVFFFFPPEFIIVNAIFVGFGKMFTIIFSSKQCFFLPISMRIFMISKQILTSVKDHCGRKIFLFR